MTTTEASRDDEDHETIIECPCADFSTVCELRLALDSDERSQKLVHWLSGRLNERALQEKRPLSCGSHCQKRIHASFSILNSIRDALKPLLEAEAAGSTATIAGGKKEASPKMKEVVYEEAFPSLGSSVVATATTSPSTNGLTGRKKKQSGFPAASNNTSVMAVQNKKSMTGKANTTSSTANKAAKKPKRRIRPVAADPPTRKSSSAWGQGNLVNLPFDGEEEQEDDPFPALGRKMASRPVMTAAIPTTTTATTPRKNGPVTTAAAAAASPPPVTPKKMVAAVVVKKEKVKEIAALPEMNRLVEVYTVLIDSFLVPSSALELHLLLRVLALADIHDEEIAVDNKDETTTILSSPTFQSILSTRARCVYFAVSALRKQSRLMQGIGMPLLKNLVRCSPFRRLLPDLTEEFTLRIQERASSVGVAVVNISVDQTALLTLPFKEERDSRHNYRTREEQALYKNREESRDAFLYQLRAFLNVRGTFVDTVQANRAIQKVRQSSRQVVNGLLDANVAWFSEFFCDLLLQIGHVPIQETDKDLLKRFDDKEKLQKLHRRFSSKAPNSDRSTKKVVADSTRREGDVSSPAASAQQLFPGHQEFFFLFVLSADSYVLGVHLRALLIAKIQKLNKDVSFQNAEKRIMDLRLFAKFLGVLVFSPNWRSTSTGCDSSTDGLHQLSAFHLSVVDIVEQSFTQQNLVVVIPWIVELLRMSKWDKQTAKSKPYLQVLRTLRQIQVASTDRAPESAVALANQVFINQNLESLFDDSIGWVRTMTIPPTDLSARESKESNKLNTLDSADVIHNQSTFYAANSHIEELISISSKLLQRGEQSMRSPGASRKLRPSVVSPVITSSQSPTSSRGVVFSDAGLAGVSSSLASGASNTVDSFQAKLRDSFFHQYGELKDLCEFATGRALKNISSQLVRNQIMPLVPEALSSEEELISIERQAMDVCSRFLTTSLEKQIRDTLRALSSVEVDQVTKDVALSLSVAHGRRIGESMVQSVVTGEMKKAKTRLLRMNRKQLFTKDADASTDHPSPHTHDHLEAVTTMMTTLAKTINELQHGQLGKLLPLLKSLDAELVDWLQNESPNIPSEKSLRPFFYSILSLDDQTDTFMTLSLSSDDQVAADIRWSVVSAYLQVTAKLTHWSHHGFRVLYSRLDDESALYDILDIGCRAGDIPSVSLLLIELVKAKVMKPACVGRAIQRANEHDDIPGDVILSLLPLELKNAIN